MAIHWLRLNRLTSTASYMASVGHTAFQTRPHCASALCTMWWGKTDIRTFAFTLSKADLLSRPICSRPRPRPRLRVPKTKTKTQGFQDQNQDQDSGVPRPRLRSPKTKATNSVTDISRNNQFYCSLFSTHLMERCSHENDDVTILITIQHTT